jgi:hydrogenase maturation protease
LTPFIVSDLGEGGDEARAKAMVESLKSPLAAMGAQMELLRADAQSIQVRLTPPAGAQADAVAELRAALEQVLLDNLPGVVRAEVELAILAAAMQNNFVPLATLRMPARLHWQTALPLSDLPSGVVRGLKIGDERALLANVGAGEVYAYRNLCPETPFPLDASYVEAGILRCAWHGCRFDPARRPTGRYPGAWPRGYPGPRGGRRDPRVDSAERGGHVTRTLIACVGNVLRGDDGFGVTVAEQLGQGEPLPPGADLIETGIGGMSIVQQLMDGYDSLIVVDALERGATPGTLVIAEPEVPDPKTMPGDEWRAHFTNLHLAEPSRVLLLARAAGVLPPRVLLIGCEPQSSEDFDQELSPPVRAAVAVACARIRELGVVEAVG